MNPIFNDSAFPAIETIDDVLPAIEGRREFIVADCGDHRIVNYTVGFQDTFAVDPDDCVQIRGESVPKGVLRRECRGLIFDDKGKTISRPFHKFFNVGENDAVQPQRVMEALGAGPHRVMEKMDGSMVRPLFTGGRMRLATKMGVTDVAVQAEKHLDARHFEWLRAMYARRLTPIHEYVGPDNRIVIPYGEPRLVLLAIRRNVSGEYANLGAGLGTDWIPHAVPFQIVPMHAPIGEEGIDGFLADHEGDEGREGFVIRLSDGNMVKTKNQWYVQIHKVKERIAHDRHILSLILDGGMDDAVPFMIEEDRKYIEDFERRFRANLEAKRDSLVGAANRAWDEAKGDRKKLATEALPASGLDRKHWGFVFKWADGKDMSALLDKFVRERLGGNARYLEVAELLDLGDGRVLESRGE